MHPSLAIVVERSAWIGGVDGVSNYIAAQKLGIPCVGTMPHALIICFENQADAWTAFDEVLPKEVPRVCLCDTYYDEKTESIMAAEVLGEKLDGVRLDTTSSRRGNMKAIVEEVRFELDIRGYEDVEIVVSGSLDDNAVSELRDVADAFGVGTFISAAKPIDYALDIVEREGVPCAKRGKLGGRKQVWRRWEDLSHALTSADAKMEGMEPILEKVMEDGEILIKPDHNLARKHLLSQLKSFF